MASLIIGAGVLAYDGIKQAKQKKKDHNSARFSELEKANAERIAGLQRNSCFCQRSDWTGEGCPGHGHGGAGSDDPARDKESAPRYSSEGSLRRDLTGSSRQHSAGGQPSVQTDEWTKALPAMDRGEIARINEERRKKGRGYKRFFGRK